MNLSKKNRLVEIIAGLSFIIATLAYAIGSGIVATGVEAVQSNISFSDTDLTLGVTLELINSFAIVIIGLMLYISLKQEVKTLSKGYFVSRILEASLLAYASISILGINSANADTVFDLYGKLFPTAMLALGVYSTYYCYILFKKKLAPSWLMITGVLGYICLTLYSLLSLFTVTNDMTMILFAPGAIFEIVFPLYLIFKGFKHTNT